MLHWVLENKEWLFSGAGIFVFSLLVGLVLKKKMGFKQYQKSGKNSTNYQAGGDINIGDLND